MERDGYEPIRTKARWCLLKRPVLGLYRIVSSHVKTEAGDVYVCTKPIREYARQAMIMDVSIVVAVSLLYWWGQLPGQ